MKKLALTTLFLLVAASTATDCFSKDRFSQSFMYTRPVTDHLGMEQALWHTIMYNKHGESRTGFQIIAMFQDSFSTPETAQYFLPCVNNNVFVSGDGNPGDRYTRDIRAEWLGLEPTFRGRFTIKPRQRQIGGQININIDLDRATGNSFFKNSWLDITLPIISVENDINLRQCDITGTTTATPQNILQAFSSKELRYGRICSSHKSRTDIADVTITLGRTFVSKKTVQLASYTKIIIPTGNIQDAKFMFDPVVGHNGHFGYGVGVNLQTLLNRHSENFRLLFYVDLEGIFFARNSQYRTVDLKSGSPGRKNKRNPWSRYVRLIKQHASSDITIPAVNVLTQKFRVRHYGNFDFSTGVRFATDGMEAELGYGIWGHSDEKLEFRCPFPDGQYGIAGTAGNTASDSTIANRTVNDSDFVGICASDLDLNSGAAKSSFNHKLQGSIGIVSKGKKIDDFFGIGGFCDIPVKNTALRSVGVWVKFGATF